jgi:DtxR family Mn-dependent transcriptional regulator
LIFAVVVTLLVVLFWPTRGLVPRLARYRRVTDRVLAEDTLKHLYNCEYAGTPATEESLAGALETSRHEAVGLLNRLQELEFVQVEGERATLTDEGRRYALRVLRSHRLWETYLAERTGVAPSEWHAQADRKEHVLTGEEAEGLASRLGYPLYDPHGDPIPTAAGRVPPARGMQLTAIEPGQAARIIHLEDEPAQLFEAIVGAGLGPLMSIRLLEATPSAVRVEAQGVEHVLDPAVASRITVEPVDEETAEGPTETLADLDEGERGWVVGISRLCQGPARRRLLDLGVVPGTLVRAELMSTGGDPVAYRIRGALIALRDDQASLVRIERVPADEQAAASDRHAADAVGIGSSESDRLPLEGRDG